MSAQDISSGSSPEASAFRKYFCRLVEGCTPELETLAVKFYSTGLISAHTRDSVLTPPTCTSKAGKLFSALEVRLDPSRMDELICILQAIPPLQEIAYNLDQCVTELRLQQKQSGGPSSLFMSAQTRRGNFRKRRSDSFTELEELFAYLMADLIEILEKEEEKMLKMMKNVLDFLPWKKNPKFKDVLSDTYKSASSIKEFFDALSLTYLDCELLQISVEATKCNEAISIMDEYLNLKETRKISAKEDEGKSEKSAPQTLENADNYTTAAAIVQQTSLTGKQYEKTTTWLSRIWEIPRAAFHFFCGRKGSFILTWAIRTSLESHVLSLPVTGQALKKLAELNVSQITLGDSYELEISNFSPEREESAYSSEAVSSAVWAGDKDMVDRLLRGGASADQQDEEGWSILHSACSRGHVEVVRLLLNSGANPNSSMQDGWSALMAAGRIESSGVTEELLKFGADPNAANDEDWTALMAAANNGRHDTVAKLLDYKADPDMQDNTGWSALMAAVWTERESIALRMIASGAKPDIQDANGTNALFLAIYRQQPSVVKAVMECRPNVNLQDGVGETPLMYACKMRDLESVTMLLESRADPNTESKSNETALLLSTQRKDAVIIEKLLKSGANADFMTQSRISALMLASREGSVEIVNLLLQYGAQPDLVDETSGYTALMFGAEANHLDVVKCLISSSAQLSLTNKDGSSAYYLAYRNKHVEVAKTIHQAHLIQTAPLPSMPSTLGSGSVELLKFLEILQSKLQRGPLLMDREFAEEEMKRKEMTTSSKQQPIAVGAV